MKNQIEITKQIADSMQEIGGNPTREEFYDEFNFRLKVALGLLQEQTIICPECKNLQIATVEIKKPFPIFIHECEKCKYLIMESEWQIATENELLTQKP
jgi:RNA polymerase subunit RPABC4/transcription elongation factor Spt4